MTRSSWALWSSRSPRSAISIALGWTVIIVAVGACSESRRALPSGSSPSTQVAADGASPGDGGPFRLTEDCRGVWQPGPLSEPWWVNSPPATCLDSVHREPAEAYDDCVPSTAGTSPAACGAPSSGAVICVGNSFYANKARLTQNCLADADCPSGMVCAAGSRRVADSPGATHGYCEKSCDPSGGPETCIRCDLACTAGGVCAPRDPAPRNACKGDCECSEGLCINGVCEPLVTSGARGICGLGGDCACRGGTCKDRCCRLADGSLAAPDSAICKP
jgi:hypothetical protein